MTSVLPKLKAVNFYRMENYDMNLMWNDLKRISIVVHSLTFFSESLYFFMENILYGMEKCIAKFCW